TDGVVKGYSYNGTLAPPYTTFFGIYDRYIAHGAGSEWGLPDRWRTPPAGLDLSTPLNFASTADTYGGNSGSPAVTPQLELVGLNFDRNIEGLSRDFIYLPERGRNIMVDVRAIRAALDHVYDADRIVMELRTGRLYETEAAADAAAR
ncbi:MAG TPA: S46 family peptidase, partial [Gemmatimonadota bacterium]|nr:S46 family peptidase [Gemmatimonadota bacterium]